ncbi:aminoglycoside phosphotransferase family protein [Kribbella sp. NPDC026611]|uniref:phosphotransferase family protein n=1 Tax=Kribbella sp. NPDC026611 TaxID=3154911 RepID=UPI00340AC0E4
MDQQDVLQQLQAVAHRHGVPAWQVKEVTGGVANRAFVLGDHLFLRTARPGYEQDLHKESKVIPTARLAGVQTPAIVEYDSSRHLLPTPYMVTERVHGIEPLTAPVALARQLVLLHQLDLPSSAVRDLRAALPEVPEEEWGDPWETVEGLAQRGYVDPGTADWLSGWFTRLAQRFDRNRPKVLIHGDVAVHNLLVDGEDNLRALIDWGDAAWAPRAMDFAKLPLTEVATLLPTYLHHTSPAYQHTKLASSITPRSTRRLVASRRETEAVEELAAAILWFQLSWAVSKLPAAPWPGQRHWTAPTASRLLSILRFFTTSPLEPWAALT